MHRFSYLAVALSITIAACGEDDGPGPDVCPATLSDLSGLTGVTHRGAIDTNTVWAAADSPHVIEANAWVSNATLTIEPCALVLLDADVHLTTQAGGNITAAGTADSPIRFDKHGAERWDYLLAHEEGAVSLAYVTLSGGGADLVTYDGATLVADGPTDRPYVQNLEVMHVTITDSAGYGVFMKRHAAFTAASTGLVISGAGTDDATHPSPMLIDAQALGSVPTGTYTGNAADQIEVGPFVVIEEHTTISDHGVPYRVSSSNPLRVARPFGDAGAIPQLTIEAGVTLAFEPGSNAALKVGTNTNPAQPGSLLIEGTSTAPVTLTSAAAAPVAGDWDGVILATGAGDAGATQSIDYAVVEYAGGDSSISGYACYSEDGSGNALSEDGAVVIFGWAPAASFLTNSTMQHSLGWGVFRGWDDTQGGDVDFTATNSYVDLTACEQNSIKDSCADTVTYTCAGTI